MPLIDSDLYLLPESQVTEDMVLSYMLDLIEQETGLTGWLYSHYKKGLGFIFTR